MSRKIFNPEQIIVKLHQTKAFVAKEGAIIAVFGGLFAAIELTLRIF